MTKTLERRFSAGRAAVRAQRCYMEVELAVVQEAVPESVMARTAVTPPVGSATVAKTSPGTDLRF
jgi:hypothetical protein